VRCQPRLRNLSAARSVDAHGVSERLLDNLRARLGEVFLRRAGSLIKTKLLPAAENLAGNFRELGHLNGVAFQSSFDGYFQTLGNLGALQ